MKKKIMFIAIPLVLIILVIIAYFMFVSNTGKYVDKSIDMIRDGIAYIGQRKYGTSGELKVTAKYKGAHGEHYPKDFSYIFETRIEDEKYKVSIGNENGFVTKEYNIELVSMINDLKEVNTTKLDYVTYKNLVLNKVNSIPETEIPIFRYFNEFEYTFWRNINE